MPAAIALSTPTVSGRVPSHGETASGLSLLVVGDLDLDRLAMRFVVSRPGASSLHCTPGAVLDFVRTSRVDLILLTVDASMMAAFVLAAHIRRTDRERDAGGSTPIVAFTAIEGKFRDCLLGGSAFNGAVKAPCDLMQFSDCIDRWCPQAGASGMDSPGSGAMAVPTVFGRQFPTVSVGQRARPCAG